MNLHILLHRLCLTVAVLWMLTGACLFAQIPGDTGSGLPQDDPSIELSFSEDVELKILVDYVAKRLNINVLYDEQIGNKRVTIKSPGHVPKSTLMDLLQSVLRMKGLVLVDADEAGWKRIVSIKEMSSYARADGEPGSDTGVVTQVFRLNHVDGKQAEQMVAPLMTRPGGNSIGIPGQPILIVTDFAANMQGIQRVLRLIDEPRGGIVTRGYTAEHMGITDLTKLVQELLSAKYKAQWGGTQDSGGQVILTPVPHASQIIAVGVQKQVDEAITLMRDLDIPERLETRAYQFLYITPTQVNALVQGLLGEAVASSKYRYVIDDDLGLLAVATTGAVHQQIEDLRRDLDRAPLEDQSPMRIYKLMNTTAADVLETIRALEGGEGFSFNTEFDEPDGSSLGDSSTPTNPGSSLAGPNGVEAPALFDNNQQPDHTRGGAPGWQTHGAQDSSGITPLGLTSYVRVATDEQTNSIIVFAPPAEQRVYERLIKMLDKRRPQVLVEATIVTLDTSDGYSFGVEIGGGGLASGVSGSFVTFSSFGLSTVDAATGGLVLTPGLGFNGTLLSSDVADVVLRALKTNGRAKVVSSPRILVNDNATGTLSSVAQEPFASVNASNTVATTTFGGQAQAGTTITITPRISLDDYLQLEYEIELSNFTGSASETLPPPSQRNTINSEVTIPDGATIIVGGINRADASETVTSIPFLGNIPYLKHLFRSEGNSGREQTLFVFIRPVILRDDQFADLKYISEKDRRQAGMDDEFPSSVPLTVY